MTTSEATTAVQSSEEVPLREHYTVAGAFALLQRLRSESGNENLRAAFALQMRGLMQSSLYDHRQYRFRGCEEDIKQDFVAKILRYIYLLPTDTPPHLNHYLARIAHSVICDGLKTYLQQEPIHVRLVGTRQHLDPLGLLCAKEMLEWCRDEMCDHICSQVRFQGRSKEACNHIVRVLWVTGKISITVVTRLFSFPRSKATFLIDYCKVLLKRELQELKDHVWDCSLMSVDPDRFEILVDEAAFPSDEDED